MDCMDEIILLESSLAFMSVANRMGNPLIPWATLKKIGA